jgi:hypothetical protein
MPPGTLTSFGAQSDQIYLRWFEAPSAPALELPVEIVEEEGPEPVFRVPLKIGEDTPVTLLGKNFMVNGIVRFCRADRNSYLITVATDEVSGERFERAQFRDPGALVIDEFLTEEEEAKILESLQDSSRSAAHDSVPATLYRQLVSSVRLGHTGLLFLTQAAKQLLWSPAAL